MTNLYDVVPEDDKDFLLAHTEVLKKQVEKQRIRIILLEAIITEMKKKNK